MSALQWALTREFSSPTELLVDPTHGQQVTLLQLLLRSLNMTLSSLVVRLSTDTAQVGPQIAEKLDLPQVTYVQKFELAKDKKSVKVERQLEDGYEVIKVNIPCMLTCIKELNTPRFMNMAGIFNPDKDIKVWSAADVEVDLNTVGLKPSPTNVFRSFTPKPKGKGTMLEGDTDKELAEKLVGSLKQKHII